MIYPDNTLMKHFMISQVYDFHPDAILSLQAELSHLKADFDEAWSVDVINRATSTILAAQASIIKGCCDQNIPSHAMSMCTTTIEVLEPIVKENFLITALPMYLLFSIYLATYEAIRTDTSFIFCLLVEIITLPWTIVIGLAEIVIDIYSLIAVFPLHIHLIVAIVASCTVHTGGVVHA